MLQMVVYNSLMRMCESLLGKETKIKHKNKGNYLGVHSEYLISLIK